MKGEWCGTTDENLIISTDYLAVSYRQSDFADRNKLEDTIRNICFHLDLDAYWVDIACIGQSPDEINTDLYRIADVFRWAKATVLMIKGQDSKPRSDGWLSWGSRMWIFPEALLSRKLYCKVGERKLKEMDLRAVANHAYGDNDDESRLISVYATNAKDFLAIPERVEMLCRSIRRRAIGRAQMATEGSGLFKGYPAEWVYALMGFFQYRVEPAVDKSEEVAFMELLERNGLECDRAGWEAFQRSNGEQKIGIRVKNSRASVHSSSFLFYFILYFLDL